MKALSKACLFFCLVVSFYYKGQVSDILAYLKSFETNKIQYIGHPLTKLLNDMIQLQPKSVWSTSIYYSHFNFCKVDNSTDIGTVNMVIYWQLPIPESESEYYSNKNQFYFTNDEKNFYGSKTVKDIYVYTTK
ncbi:hypothetical protein [Chryseobacterium mulctrae]|uniref:hypothetical protein n=1 Tax=Chryseobacterium mulctrae TaxID=2576777 RepID=UPI001116C1DC|nr:hypothetical protein [Chryseobacterium mulctrae]